MPEAMVEALRIKKDALGERAPNIAVSLNNLAMLYASQGKPELAEPLYLASIRIVQNNLEESSSIQSEADQIRHVAVSRLYISNYLALAKADAAKQYGAVFRVLMARRGDSPANIREACTGRRSGRSRID